MEQHQQGHNAFDDLGVDQNPEETERIKKEQESTWNRVDYLTHKVFEQTEEGRELLEIYKEALIVTPGAMPGMDQVEVGIIEGRKAFIRNIILTIRRVENG